jgi:arsenate reductase
MTWIYGIKQCSTMQKAFAWLDAQGVTYTFHDYKKLGIDIDTLRCWAKQAGWEALLNMRGTTWRKLADDERADLDEEKAIHLMQTHTSVIRRPIIAVGETLLIGFDATRYSETLKGQP